MRKLGAPTLARPHLLERLLGHRVGLLVAPAGYGKSTLLSQLPEGFAWHEVSEADRCPEQLRSHLADGGPAMILDRLERLAGAEQALRVLGEALAGRHRFMLASRLPLHIPGMAQLRLQAHVVELGPLDLLFSPTESGALGASDEVDRLACGWPAALRLMSQGSGAEWHEFYDYIDSEVMSLLPEVERRWLHDLGVLHHWSSAGVGRVLDRPDADRLLLVWERRLPVDRSGRVHPLMQRYCQERLATEPDRRRLMNRRVALWLNEEGDLERALEHALSAEDLGLAVPLLHQVGARLLERSQVEDLEALLEQVDTAVMERVPELLLQVGERLRRSENPRRAVRWLRLAAVGFAADGDGGGLYRAFCRLALTHADVGEWREMEAALQQIEAEVDGAVGRDRAEALRALGEYRLHLGQADSAATLLQESAQLFAAHGDSEGAGAARRALAVATRHAPASVTPRLQIECLGAFRVVHGGREVPVSHWGRAQVRTLLQFLLLQPGFAAPRDTLLEAIWPGDSPTLSRARLRVVLNRLRQALLPLGCHLEAGADLVRLPMGGEFDLDLQAFRGHLAAARELVGRNPEAALEHCRAGRELFRGPLLVDAFWPGVEPYREAVSRERAELLQVWEDAALRLNRTDEAIAVLEYHVGLEPGQEEVSRRLMGLLIRTGRRVDALRRYRELARWLRDEMGLDPTSQTQALFRQALD